MLKKLIYNLLNNSSFLFISKFLISVNLSTKLVKSAMVKEYCRIIKGKRFFDSYGVFDLRYGF